MFDWLFRLFRRKPKQLECKPMPTVMQGHAFVIYEQETPKYHPRFVARRYVLTRAGMTGPVEPTFLGDTIEAVRMQLPEGLYPQPAAGKDREDRLAFTNGARIIETWL